MPLQWQYVRSCQSFNYIPINLYVVKDTTNYIWKVNYNFCSPKKADTTNFSSEKAHTLQTFVVPKADTLNFCNEKAHTTTFCNDKKRTLQTFVVLV